MYKALCSMLKIIYIEFPSSLKPWGIQNFQDFLWNSVVLVPLPSYRDFAIIYLHL